MPRLPTLRSAVKSASALSTVAIVGGITAFGLMTLAAVLLIPTGSESTQRLGVFSGIAAVVVTALVALLKADQAAQSSAQAATQTNGSLDDRIMQAVLNANFTRRSADLPSPAMPSPTPAAEPDVPLATDPAADPATAP